MNQPYIDQCDHEERVDVGGPNFHTNAAVVKAYIVRLKTKENKNRPCIIHYHGGGAIAGTAEGAIGLCSRYAIECDATVITVDYRLAPEAKAPCGIDDSYAALKWVIANADQLGIDANRIAIWGESGGAYITAGVSIRLAQNNERNLIKFQGQHAPMTANYCYTKTEEFFDDWDWPVQKFQHGNYKALAADYDNMDVNDIYLFPNEISDDLCVKCPPLVVITSEFDDCRKPAD